MFLITKVSVSVLLFKKFEQTKNLE